jgi:hypothetical protein
MQLLLQNIVTRIATNLTYLTWVGVLDNELLPPQSPSPPFVGLKDGGLSATARPGKTDLEELRINVVIYQSVMHEAPGASIMGEPSLGDAGRGVLQIGEAIKGLLNDDLFSNTFYFAHRDRVEPSNTIIDEEGRYLQYQRHLYVYRRVRN